MNLKDSKSFKQGNNLFVLLLPGREEGRAQEDSSKSSLLCFSKSMAYWGGGGGGEFASWIGAQAERNGWA